MYIYYGRGNVEEESNSLCVETLTSTKLIYKLQENEIQTENAGFAFTN